MSSQGEQFPEVDVDRDHDRASGGGPLHHSDIGGAEELTVSGVDGIVSWPQSS